MGALFGRSRKGADAADAADPSDAYPLEALLSDMHDLRMTLAVDLTAAAGAADAGADDVARDIIEADRRELARFARVANLKLEDLAGGHLPVKHEPSPWRRRVVTALPVIPVVGAMALSAAAATGVLQLPGTGHAPAHRAVVTSTDAGPVTTFKQLVNVLNSDPSASQVIAAASKLHRQLSQLIAVSSTDPSQAAEIARLLQMEQSLLMREQPPGASIVLNATRKLAARLITVVPTATPSIAPTFVPTPQPSPRHTHRAVASPPAAPSPSPTPTATASATPTSTPSNRPDSSPSADPSQFPRIPR